MFECYCIFKVGASLNEKILIIKTNYITVVNNTSIALPLSEGFTGATFPPTNWNLINTDASAITWARSATVGFAPTAGNSMFFNNFAQDDITWFLMEKK